MLDKVYVIHYSKLSDRRKAIESFFGDHLPIVEFIEDYDRESIDGLVDSYFKPDLQKYLQKSSVYDGFVFGKPNFRELSRGEISCSMKHTHALYKCITNNEIALIIEDDVIPYDMNFMSEILEMLNILPNDWDVIFLGLGCGLEFIEKIKKTQVSDKIFKVEHPASNCAEAYIVNQKSASKLLNNIVPIQLPYDCELACAMGKHNMNVYWILPSFFYQGSITGDYKSTLR